VIPTVVVGDLSEKQTRKQLIDPMFEQWGWRVVPYPDDLPSSGTYAIEEYPNEAGPADYALYADGRVIGIVEAKRLTVNPQGVSIQAECYSRGIWIRAGAAASLLIGLSDVGGTGMADAGNVRGANVEKSSIPRMGIQIDPGGQREFEVIRVSQQAETVELPPVWHRYRRDRLRG
jgi:hypothetical protein